jgi:hypothetical protein
MNLAFKANFRYAINVRCHRTADATHGQRLDPRVRRYITLSQIGD